MSFVVPNTLKGFGVTLKQVFKKPITQQYPEYKRPVYPRYRGRHRLHKHENGLEKCVGCSLCAAACPADCIRVVPAENTPDNRVSAGERYARIYEINMSRCIFCGYCELACPFDAITLGNDFEISEHNRDDLIYTKDILLAPPMKRVPVADAISTTRRSRTTRTIRSGELPGLGRLVRRRVRVPRERARGRHLPQPVLLGALADREPRLARGALPAALGRVRRGGQVLVYGGAVMVMFLFVIAYLGDRSEESPWSGGPSWQIVGAVLAGGALLAEVCVVVGLKAGGLLSSTQHVDRSFGSPEAIGKLFLTDHLLAFEITSVVLLVAAVGGVVLGSHARQMEGDARA